MRLEAHHYLMRQVVGVDDDYDYEKFVNRDQDVQVGIVEVAHFEARYVLMEIMVHSAATD